MSHLVKVISTKAAGAFRKIKSLGFGKDDVQEVDQVAPYGVDSNPVKDMVAVYSDTSIMGENVIVGYLNKSHLAAVGEIRTYSTDADGAVKFYMWQKNDGTCEIGGTADNMTRYKPVEQVVKDIQDFLNQQLPMIATGISAGGGSYSPGTASFDVSGAKIDEIKTL